MLTQIYVLDTQFIHFVWLCVNGNVAACGSCIYIHYPICIYIPIIRYIYLLLFCRTRDTYVWHTLCVIVWVFDNGSCFIHQWILCHISGIPNVFCAFACTLVPCEGTTCIYIYYYYLCRYVHRASETLFIFHNINTPNSDVHTTRVFRACTIYLVMQQGM